MKGIWGIMVIGERGWRGVGRKTRLKRDTHPGEKLLKGVYCL